jgi:hypothetical protein
MPGTDSRNNQVDSGTTPRVELMQDDKLNDVLDPSFDFSWRRV